MKIQHIRNATTLVTLGPHRLLVDPMLCQAGTMPSFRLFRGPKRRNPTVPLPDGTTEALDLATAVVITHEHPDHLDATAVQWIRDRGLDVWANAIDANNLRKKGLPVRELAADSLGMQIEVVPSRHGRGLLGWLMGPVVGYFLAYPGEPTVYFTGDSVLTDTVVDAIERLAPDILVAPAGGANMGIGGDILFSKDELVQLAKLAPGEVVLNHLEALDHCWTTRCELTQRMAGEGLASRVHIPMDGEVLEFARCSSAKFEILPSVLPKPGVQKWLTAKFSGS